MPVPILSMLSLGIVDLVGDEPRLLERCKTGLGSW